MSVFLQPDAKKKIWWYRFMMRGQVIRCSTKQSSHKVALQLESEHKSRLAKGDMGIFDKKPAPTLAAFSREFLSWAETQFRAKPNTFGFYRNGVRRLLEYRPLASAPLDDRHIGELLVRYVSTRQTAGLQVSSVNRELQVLRRLLHLAVEWGRIDSAVTVKMLPGETHRELVIPPGEESRYLAAAQPLLASVATVLVDTGMRPEEAYRLRWEFVTWVNGRYGSMLVTHGKTKAARRLLPMSSRVRAVLEARWHQEGQPLEGWVWPAPTKSGHVEPSGLKKQHARAIKQAKMRPFILYSFRHTFLTRLGASGCDAWTLARIAGHSSIAISMRYVHASNDTVLAAMENPNFSGASLSGQEFGHGEENPLQVGNKEKLLIA